MSCPRHAGGHAAWPHLNCGVSSGAPPVRSTTLTLLPPAAAAALLLPLVLPLPAVLLLLDSISATQRSATSRLIISVRLRAQER
jgi:hypothetical protein